MVRCQALHRYSGEAGRQAGRLGVQSSRWKVLVRFGNVLITCSCVPLCTGFFSPFPFCLEYILQIFFPMLRGLGLPSTLCSPFTLWLPCSLPAVVWRVLSLLGPSLLLSACALNQVLAYASSEEVCFPLTAYWLVILAVPLARRAYLFSSLGFSWNGYA